jgi:integrase
MIGSNANSTMSIRNMRGKLQYRFMIRGHVTCRTLELSDTPANRILAARLEAEHKKRVLAGEWEDQPIAPRKFRELVPEFKEWCRTEYLGKDSTRKRIDISLVSLTEHFGEQLVLSIRPADVERFKSWRLVKCERQPVTVKHDLDNLSIFFQWAIKFGYAKRSALEGVSRPSDADAKRQRVLTPEEEERYFAAAKGNLRSIAMLIRYQGMRPEEAMRLRKADIDWDHNWIIVRKGKTGAAQRKLLIDPKVDPILREQMQTPGPWLFPSPRRPGEPITKLNGPHDRTLERLNPCAVCGALKGEHPMGSCPEYKHPKNRLWFVLYELRHTFATRKAEDPDITVYELAAILGHSSPRILNRYVHPQQVSMDRAMRPKSRSEKVKTPTDFA